MASGELIVDVHHHFMPAMLFDRLATQAGGKRIVTNEISLTLHPFAQRPRAAYQLRWTKPASTSPFSPIRCK